MIHMSKSFRTEGLNQSLLFPSLHDFAAPTVQFQDSQFSSFLLFKLRGLNFPPVGLSPTVHASLRWTHTLRDRSSAVFVLNYTHFRSIQPKSLWCAPRAVLTIGSCVTCLLDSHRDGCLVRITAQRRGNNNVVFACRHPVETEVEAIA